MLGHELKDRRNVCCRLGHREARAVGRPLVDSGRVGDLSVLWLDRAAGQPLLPRVRHEPFRACHACGSEQPSSAAFCSECGVAP